MVTSTLLVHSQCEVPENMWSGRLPLFLVDYQFLHACTQYFTLLLTFPITHIILRHMQDSALVSSLFLLISLSVLQNTPAMKQ